MDIEFLSRRQAVTEWRDRQLLHAMTMLNTAGIEARTALDRQIKDAALIQSVWDPAGFVNARIDELMRAEVALRIDTFLDQAAQELRALEPRFFPLADALAASASAIEMPAAAEPEPATPSDTECSSTLPLQQGEGRLSRVTKRVGDLAIARSAREWGIWAADGVTSVADTVSRSLQDTTGLYERLRRLGTERIASAWMGDAGTPRPPKAQLILLIEDVTHEARSVNL
nr:hypothetical protein [uncultured Novosphingobium sp.]